MMFPRKEYIDDLETAMAPETIAKYAVRIRPGDLEVGDAAPNFPVALLAAPRSDSAESADGKEADGKALTSLFAQVDAAKPVAISFGSYS